MKKNRIQHVKDLKEITEKLENYRKKLLKHKNEEKVLEEGLTNNSKIKFEIFHINLFTVQNKNTISYTVKVSFDENNSKEVEIAEPNVRKKYIMYININLVE